MRKRPKWKGCMTLLLKTLQANEKALILALLTTLVIVRIASTNVNSAEWGDSYRILEASRAIRQFTYPENEKRPPLFSAILAVRPQGVDEITWARGYMLVTTLLTLFVFGKFAKVFIKSAKWLLLAVVFLLINPIFYYWSLRVYAGVLFALLVLTNFYFFEIWKGSQSLKHALVLGIVCGFSILTRFEGYLLLAATLVGLVYTTITDRTAKPLLTKLKQPLLAFISTGLIIIPWLVYKKPLASSYFEEPAGREYGLTMLATYVVSYLFILGVVPSFALAFSWDKNKFANLGKYSNIAAFVILESILILVWPAALPRLFMPILPIFVLLVQHCFSGNNRRVIVALATFCLVVLYILFQGYLRLQFLGSHTLVFICIALVSTLAALSMLLRKLRLFLLFSLVSALGMLGSVIYLHKDVYKTIKDVSVRASRERAGKVIHNDTSGIVDWYLNTNKASSTYQNLVDKKFLKETYLQNEHVTYIVITNEHDPNLDIDLKKRPYLSLIDVSENRVGGKMFHTWLVQVN